VRHDVEGRSNLIRQTSVAAIGLVSTLVACAPDDEEIDLPIEVCGQDEPVQILALEDEQVIGERASARFEDRWLFGVRTFDIPLTRVNTALQGAEGRPYRQTGAEIVSVGECGEDRRVVASGADTIFPATSESEPWLACTADTGELYWFDPAGAWEPRFIGRSERCGQHLVRGSTIFVLLADGALLRARLQNADFVAESLVSDVVQAPDLLDHRIAGVALPDDVFVLRSDRSLARVALRTGAVQLELEGADGFDVSDDRRWLTWGVHDRDGNPLSAWLRDRESGEDILLGAPTWRGVTAYLRGGFAVVSGFSDGALPEMQVLEISTSRSVWLTGNYVVWGVVEDVVVIADLTDFNGSIPFDVERIDFESLERTKLTESSGTVVVEHGAVWQRDSTRYEGSELPDALTPFDVVRFPVDTLERDVVRARVFSSFELSDDRWIVSDSLDEDLLADLRFLDGASLRHRAFAEDVILNNDFDLRREASQGPPPIIDELTYQVHARSSDRTGVWRVRFGAR
jgi:hypothetical protein